MNNPKLSLRIVIVLISIFWGSMAVPYPVQAQSTLEYIVLITQLKTNPLMPYNAVLLAINQYQKNPTETSLGQINGTILLFQPFNNIKAPDGLGLYDSLRRHLASVLFGIANTTINGYQQTPNPQNLSAAVQSVLALKPYNDILADSKFGYYDSALNQLMQIVINNLPNINNIDSITPPAHAGGGFGSAVALDGAGDIFISTASGVVNGNGVIYEFSKNANNQWTVINQISQTNPLNDDHFGRAISINGSTLAASSEPTNGKARVYIFSLQKNKTWKQQDYLELTKDAHVRQINLIYLASTFNTIVVGLPFQNEYLVYDHVFAYNNNTHQLSRDKWRLALSGNLSGITSLAADGLFIAIGSNSMGPHGVPTGMVKILDGYIKMSTRETMTYYSMNWIADTQVTGSNGFGLSVAIYQDPPLALPIGNPMLSLMPVSKLNKVTVAIGSPFENQGTGAVYTLVKDYKLPSSNRWSGLNPLALLMPSSLGTAGYELALRDHTLLVSARHNLLTTAIGVIIVAIINPVSESAVMAYHLNDTTNQWEWAYTVSNPDKLFGNSLATDGLIAAIGVPKASNDTNTVDISEVKVVSPNLVNK